ncbi:MAG: hypothetical protein JXB36_17915, partial [Gammaproteobacteria bacterium]|nr:hypothetical protein [Gammaproteobacteria bacterium]
TDPQKLPITVLSRCLQFNLKRLTGAQIEAQLAGICEKEGVGAEPEGLKALAKAADGSMRDALSMLDQGIAFGGGEIRAEQVNAMLGTIDRGHVLRLLEALAAEDGAALLDEVERLDERAPDYAAVLDELMSTLQRLAVIQLVGERAPEDELEALKPLAARISPEDVQLYYQIALQGKRDLPVGRDPRVGVEMTLLRMLAFRPQAEDSGGGAAAAVSAGPGSAPAKGPAAGAGSAAGAAAPAARPGSAAGPGPAAAGPARPSGASGAAAIRAKLAASGGSGARRSGGATGSGSPAASVGATGPGSPAGLGSPAGPGGPAGSGGAARPGGSGTRAASAPAARSARAAGRTGPRHDEPPPQPPPDEAPPWLDEYDAAPAEPAPAPPPADEGAAAADSAAAAVSRPDASGTGAVGDWAALVREADIRGGARQLADHCELAGATGKRLELILAEDKQTLNTQQLRERLQAAVSQHLGRQVTLNITPGRPPRPTPADVRIASENARMRRARESMEQDPNVKAAQEAFGAVLEADSIQPTDDD